MAKKTTAATPAPEGQRKARVLVTCEYGECNSVFTGDEADIEAGKNAGMLDDAAGAVEYAEELAEQAAEKAAKEKA